MAFANPMFEKVKDLTKKDVFFKAINEGFVYNESQLKELRALEEVVMVGYPIGLWDKNNNLPIFRTGSTASHPAYDFNEKGIGLVDMACFPGSSGSPIYIMNEISYIDKKGTIHMGSSRLIFLGILYSGASLDAKGEILVESIPTQQTIFSKTKLMTNLGYYIKAHELSEFRETIKQKLNSVIRKE
ncbi:hypothetical protein SDC9_120337 [bioreactor metagenome]|uniref:Uncharacterized protein n=2 Tax=root TaxID=1 RepID=A0A645C7W8_9ZZZZ